MKKIYNYPTTYNNLYDSFFTPINSWFESAMTDFFSDVKPFDFNVAKSRIYPKLDVRKENNDIIVEASVPFLKKDNLDVSIANGLLTIKGSVDKVEQQEDDCYYHKELTRASFSRSLPIEASIYNKWVESYNGDILDKVTATLENGILTIRLNDILNEVEDKPKLPETKKIPIMEITD